MKQFLQLLFSLSFALVLSQNQRFYYDYQFQTDSTDSQTKKSELMVLDIDKKGSKYYSEYVFHNDSLMEAHFS
jgi:GLPGLI family protein